MYSGFKVFYDFVLEQIILLIGFLFAFLFIAISFFNHPSADDYCYAFKSKDIGFWQAQKEWYMIWSGRYTANFILSIDILDSKYFLWYKVFPVLLIVGIIVALFLLVKEVFKKQSILCYLKITMLLFLLYMAQLPIVSEGFYWWAGAVSYQMANILTIILIRNLIAINRKFSISNLIFSCLISFILVGLNETIMVLVNVLLLWIIIFDFFLTKRVNVWLLIIFIFCLIGGLIVYFAPGNDIRSSYQTNPKDLLFSLKAAVIHLILSISTWSGLVLLVSFLIYLEINKKKQSNFFKIDRKKKLQALFFLGIIYLGFFIGFWATGNPIPPRTRNVIYLLFMLGVIYFSLSFMIKNNIVNKLAFFNKQVYSIITVCVLTIFLGKQNFVEILKDFGKSKAKLFDIEMNKRKLIVEQKVSKGETEIILEPIVNEPETIFTSDLKKDKNHFYNSCYSEYLGIKSVRVE